MPAPHAFRPAWWLRGGHLQTVAGTLRRPSHAFRGRALELDTPDGDRLRLHLGAGSPRAPLLLLLHGLEGDLRSRWVQEVGGRARARGFRTAALELRGCGAELNPAPRLYHMGDWADLLLAAEDLARRHEGPLVALGFSMGGALLANALALHPRDWPATFRGGLALGAPFELEITGPLSDRALGGVYRRHFLRGLKRRALRKLDQHPGLLDARRVRACRTLEAFDTVVTAALHGFEDAWDYWRRTSCGPRLAEVRHPLLFVSADDDPLVPSSTWPGATVGPCVRQVVTRGGGHLGFLEGRWPPFASRARLAEALLDEAARLLSGAP